MSLANRVQALIDNGEYRDALRVLDNHDGFPVELAATKLFLESHSGDLACAQRFAERMLQRPQPPTAAAVCKQVVGRSMLVHGQGASAGLRHCSEALEIAAKSLSKTLSARFLADYVTTLLHRVGINEAAAELHGLRSQALAAGDALALISANLLQAEIRVKQTRYRDASLDLATVDALLVRRPHVIFESRRNLVAAAIESTNGTSSRARRAAEYALALADRSGALSLRIPVLGTLAHVLLTSGDFSGCSSRLNEAFAIAHPGSPALVVLNDTKLQLLLATGDDRRAAEQAQHTQGLSIGFDHGHSYYGLWHSRTRARWLLTIGHSNEALALLETTLPLAERTGDVDLLVRMALLKAEALGACGRWLDGANVLAQTLSASLEPSLEIVGEASRVSGQLCLDEPEIAVEHFERSARTFEAIGHVAAHAEAMLALTRARSSDREGRLGPGRSAYCRAISSAAALGHFRSHPLLLATEVCHIVESANSDRWGVPVTNCSPVGIERTEQLFLDAKGAAGVSVYFPATAIARTAVGAIERLLATAVRPDNVGVHEAERSDSRWIDEQPEFVFEAPAMRRLLDLVSRIASSNSTVLITGETGTGKEVLARAVHRASGRPSSAFFPFNCTTIPRELLDGQLFGYRRGSFTGATGDYDGLIVSADGGTLFLDEIGEMPLDVQPKLLRFLESGEVLPIGQPRVSHVKVRVIAATNANLETLVAQRRFREDLYFRLKVLPLRVPPLRERREEIPELIRALTKRIALEHQCEPPRFSEAAVDFMVMYSWPGNVRELANELRRVFIVSGPGTTVQPSDLAPEIVGSGPSSPTTGQEGMASIPTTEYRGELAAAVQDLERRMIKDALERFSGRPSEAARSLGLSRKGLFLKRRRLGFD